MEQEKEVPKPALKSISLTQESAPKPLKVKIIELKGKDEQFYSVIFNLLEDSIMIEAYDMNDISSTKYMNNLSLDYFQKLNFFFHQFETLKEIFTLFEEMQQTEFMITKNNSKEIEFILLIEIRKKINEIKISLEIQKNDINKIVYNLCEKVKELKILKEDIKNIKNENKILTDEISSLKKINENSINILNEKLENKIKEDNQTINQLKEEIKTLNEKLDNKTREDNQKIDQLKEENKSLNEKIEKMNNDLENNKNENKNDINNINNKIEQSNNNIKDNKLLIETNKKYIDNYNIIFNISDRIINEFSDSIHYLINNKISIDSNIIKNNFELAQINNGIKHQLKQNILKLNLLYRCSRDGDSKSTFHNKCDNHSNILVIVETS